MLFLYCCKVKKKGADGKPITVWIECSLWGKRADALAQYLTKGTIVVVTGEPGVDSYQNQSGQLQLKQVLTVEDITLLGGGTKPVQPMQAPQYQQPMQQAPMGNPGTQFSYDTDDVPFGNFELRTLA
ncbi:single-stranded DNA-binding protein [Thiomicrorhabdus aquaedulcis]|uniref:single-stranded DNA-binding protein n=1 Tax=Thiomicrorhabdus aquaedulcis TaxID=2211106 RepID=UPI000FD87D80|nr:single-stranded DNA-binding protein [Thiomicrorhabdus aquaedulcis]